MSVIFDYARESRIGLPEAVFCEGKPFKTLLTLFEKFGKGSGHPILFTRLDESIFQKLSSELQNRYDYDPLSRTAFGEKMPHSHQGSCAIVSAGTADGFVAHEAARTLEYLGFKYQLLEDCGVAGLWRLTERLELINKADCIIVIAGLDAALASVMGGLTPSPSLPYQPPLDTAWPNKDALLCKVC